MKNLVIRKRYCSGSTLRIGFCVALNFILLMKCPGAYCNSNGEFLFEKSAMYREIMCAAIKWKDALLNKDIDGLTSFALPEAQEGVRTDLKNKSATLYRIFYDSEWNRQVGSRSVWDMLKSAKKLKIVLEKHKELEKWGHGVTVNYYDEDKLKLEFPLDDNERQLLLNGGNLVSMFFFKVGNSWYTSYEFD